MKVKRPEDVTAPRQDRLKRQMDGDQRIMGKSVLQLIQIIPSVWLS